VANTIVTQSNFFPKPSNTSFRVDIYYDDIRKLYREDHYHEYENTTQILLPKNNNAFYINWNQKLCNKIVIPSSTKPPFYMNYLSWAGYREWNGKKVEVWIGYELSRKTYFY